MPHTSPTPQDLLDDSAWMRAMALGILRDEARAEEVVQDAWLVQLDRDDRDSTPPRHGHRWLSGVVRHLALRHFRDETRRRRRERRASKPEADVTTPASILERAEVHRRVVEAVVALDEPYRSTILLRFFDALPRREIALRQNVPVATVATRLRRGLVMLRERFERSEGRDAWLTSLGVVAGLPLRTNEATAATGTAAAPSIASASFGGATPTLTSTGTIASTGITLMNVKTLAVAGVLGAAVGWGIGRAPGADAPPPPERPAEIADAQLSDLENRVRSLQRANAAARKELDAAIAARDAWKQLAEAKEPPPTEAVDASQETAAALPVSFDGLPHLADLHRVLSSADWATLANAAEIVQRVWLDFEQALENGEEATIDEETNRQLMLQNAEFLKLVAELTGRVATHAKYNGEFTHPLTVSNLAATMLERGGIPLSEAQIDQIARHGERYEAAFGELQATYDDSSLALHRWIDELELKSRFVTSLEGELSDEQAALLFPDLTAGRLRRDMLSPLLMAMAHAKPQQFSDSTSLQETYAESIAQRYELGSDALAHLAPALENYARELRESSTNPAPGAPHIDAVLAAARSHAKVLAAIRDLPDLPEATRGRLLEELDFTLPAMGSPQ